MDLEKLIENAWVDRALLNEKEVILAIKTVVDDLDIGRRRIAEPVNGIWQVNEWLKKAVILYFPLMKMQLIEVGPFQFHDKIKFNFLKVMKYWTVSTCNHLILFYQQILFIF